MKMEDIISKIAEETEKDTKMVLETAIELLEKKTDKE